MKEHLHGAVLVNVPFTVALSVSVVRASSKEFGFKVQHATAGVTQVLGPFIAVINCFLGNLLERTDRQTDIGTHMFQRFVVVEVKSSVGRLTKRNCVKRLREEEVKEMGFKPC